MTIELLRWKRTIETWDARWM